MKGYTLCKDVPKRCVECECFDNGDGDGVTDGPSCCHPLEDKERRLPDEIYRMMKPNWCPIKPLPERCDYSVLKDVNPRMVSWCAGWNACLEMLEGKDGSNFDF